jgi:transposase-like protein
MSKPRRQHSREFKISVVREIEGGTPVVEVARRHRLHPNMLSKWCSQYRANPHQAFCRGISASAENEARVTELEQMVGRLTMENAFLKKALQRLEQAGGLSLLRHGSG